MPEYYAQKKEEVLTLLKTSEQGLSSAEAQQRLSEAGYNELATEKSTPAIVIFLRQFKDFLIILLLVATVISILLGEYVDAVAMFAIVILSALLGFQQEYKAEKALEALKKISAPYGCVIRDGVQQKIHVREIVPGDMLVLDAGEIIPADARILEATSLAIDEAALTGESVPSAKITTPLARGFSVADLKNMAFMGTIVTYGKGKAVVTQTGMHTELGKIATSIQTTKETQTPLQLKFERMSKQIGIAVLVLVGIVFAAYVIRSDMLSDFTFSKLTHPFIFALSLAVAAVPSSLPAIVNISLALGTKILAKKNMIIKKLPAAESLGSVTIICSDKTGTMTKNQMTVTHIYANDETVTVSGSGYTPQGTFQKDGTEISPKKIELLCRIGYMCNNAQLTNQNNEWNVIGDPTEGALIVVGKKANVADGITKIQKIDELPFDSERKLMSVIVADGKKKIAYVKGAPDLLLKICDKILSNGKVRKLTPKDRQKILQTNEAFANQALRVLGFAYRELPSLKKFAIDTVEKNLVFVGLTGMIDPPREEVKIAIEECAKAQIKVIMITGDHALTAKAVAQQIGLFKEGDTILNGEEIDKITDDELAARIETVRIIARALPIQKSRVVDILKQKGHIVAMTGDGVNDAPAIKKADVGIAMGITGTDVAKEVSKAILTDDNFATIVNAIKEGRNIYDKILKSTRYLLSCNMGEIVTVFMAIMLNFPLPLIPLQILFMNLVTDGLPALGLGAEPAEDDIMERPPRDPQENPISGQLLVLIVIFGIIMGIGTLFLFNFYYQSGDLKLAQTIAFTTLVMFEMFAVLGSRSLHPLKKLNPFTNMWLFCGILSSVLLQIIIIYVPFLQPIFGTVPLGGMQWLHIILISSLGFIVLEVSKFFVAAKRKVG